MARWATACILLGATDQPVAATALCTYAEPRAAAATVAGAAPSHALPPGQPVPRGAGADGDADVPGRDESAEDLRGHSEHVPEDLEQHLTVLFEPTSYWSCERGISNQSYDESWGAQLTEEGGVEEEEKEEGYCLRNNNFS